MTLARKFNHIFNSPNKSQELESICNETVYFNDTCHKILDEYFLIELQLDVGAQQGLTPEVLCHNMGYCTAEHTQQLSTAVPKTVLLTTGISLDLGSGMQCVICLTLAKNLKLILLKHGGSYAEKALNKICDNTIIFASPCKEVVSLYLPQLVKLLHDNLPVEQVCKLIHLCAPNHATDLQNLVYAPVQNESDTVHFSHFLLPRVSRTTVLEAIDGPVLGVQALQNVHAANIQELDNVIGNMKSFNTLILN